MLSYGKQSISEDDIDAVVRSLRSDFLTSGPEVESFEEQFSSLVGAKHAVAVCNATAALHLAMKVLGVGLGDRVVTSPNTFLASANAAAYVDAVPDFADVDPVFHNLDPLALENNWQRDTKAVVAVDYAGVPCNMPEISQIARDRGAYVIEDACHGIGGGFEANGKRWKLGGHPWADITTFSFHPVKTMTTGEGGMLVTDNEEWANKARLLRSHGVTRDPSDFIGLLDDSTQVSDFNSQLSELGPWYYEMHELGYNFRITDIQCALGHSQLSSLPRFVARRRDIAARYNRAFAGIGWLTPPAFESRENVTRAAEFSFRLENLSLHLYCIQIDYDMLGKSRSEVVRELRDKGVGTQVHYIPVHLQPWYRRTYGYGAGKCPVAEQFYTRALTLPLYPAMTDKDVGLVIDAVLGLA
jgi:perosamine synthetase